MPEFEALLADGSILDAFNIPLGKGASRQTFASASYPDHVAKVMFYPPAGANALEWENWRELKGGGYAKWFAPCVAYCPKGDILVMERTQPIPRRFWPQFVPAFFGDMHRQNFGLLRGHFVCHDYSHLHEIGNSWTRAPWRGRREGCNPNWKAESPFPHLEFFEGYYESYLAAIRERRISVPA